MSSQNHQRPAEPGFWTRIFENNKGAVLILLAEAVATTMDAIVRWLQQGSRPIPPFQIIFARMAGTAILSSLYMWLRRVPDFPLGQAGVRGLLLIRAFLGFTGLWCLYYSIHFLPLAEATVFRFLVPIVTAFACSIFVGSVFAAKDLGAGVIALIGVVIIAHPSVIFGSTSAAPNTIALSSELLLSKADNDVSAPERLTAIAISLLGVVFASGAYTMIRIIGNRAHALISVNYFAVISVIGSTIILLLSPDTGFTKPESIREWAMLVVLGVSGFILQFLLTTGLQMDKSSKATTMMYSQVVFALIFDWAIWRIVPSTWSIVGGIIVIVSTFWAALQKAETGTKKTAKSLPIDEERPLLGEREDR